ncbi:arylesterase [Martelella mediterranea]|uniref:Arylesterase n=1 Tax=Martelella mediterranea DSM 17316 TaxID=1122214 RepID=A0A1U9YYC6_9HYPH|nr:arylesterase [Martelella mediterranea]AQZ50441.1 Arylesterase precursor [Martelella mediterranea DSM 17316]
MRLKATAPIVFAGLAFMATTARAEMPLEIVVLGDSLVAGYELAPGEDYPSKLEAALKEAGYDVAISNAGVSGDTTSGGLARLDWSVPDSANAVILELGANDALRGLSPDQAAENLSAIIERLQDREIPVMLMGMMAPPNMGADYAADFNAIYPELASEYGLDLYPFFLDGVATHAEYQLADGMHPNAEGVDVMVENTLPSVEAFIRSIRPQSGGQSN